MNPVPPLPFPGSRTVTAWWRELAPQQPLRLWLCHLLLHRVEALAEIRLPFSLDGLRLELLRSLAASRHPAELDSGFQARLGRELIAAGLLARKISHLQITDAGRCALATGRTTVDSLHRRVFYFLDNRAVQRPPHLLRVRHGGTPVAPPEPWEFDPELLRDAARREATWKECFGFPEEVTGVRLFDPDAPDWRAVVFDRAEYLFVALVELAPSAGERRLVGYTGKTEGWVLEAREPSIELGMGWEEVLPDLAIDPSEELWRAAWQAWGQQHSLPPAEIADCQLKRSGFIVRIETPRRLMTRLREIRSDALKGETWLLTGTGRARAAARVELIDRDG